MKHVPHTWLFTRGSDSVRILREMRPCRLRMYGPGAETVTVECADLGECIQRQGEIERNLLTAGFRRLHLPWRDRRTGHGTWSGTEHRRVSD
jgi:hypothetical protein